MTTGSTTSQTIEEWARIVLEIWQDRMMKYNVRSTGALFTSLVHHVTSQANGDSSKIDFFFNNYGVFVDMGVGREFNVGNSGDIGVDRGMTNVKRKAKPWYSPAFYGQVRKLGEILATKFGSEAAKQIVGFMVSGADDRISAYRAASNARSSRNYQRRRSLSGHWTKQGQWKIGFKLENHNFSK